MMNMKNSGNRNMSLFFSGLGAGVALGILFAPKSGDQMRARIRETVASAKGKAMEQRNSLIEGFNAKTKTVESAVQAGREAYRGAADRVSEATDSVSGL